MNQYHLSREQLYAYGDGVLSGGERRTVEQHLATCGECQAQLAQSASVIRALKLQVGTSRAPESLRAAVLRQMDVPQPQRLNRAQPSKRVLALAFAGGIALALLVLIVMLSFGSNRGGPLVAELVTAHRQLTQEPERVQMQGDAVELSNWLADWVHEPIKVPAPEGFGIVGARIETIDGQLAGHILYQPTNAAALSLFLWRGAVSTNDLTPRQMNGGQFYVGTQDGETVVLWHDDDLNYACVGDGTPDAMLELAARVWRGDGN